jgi:O-acetyl-ADP-ribose deacetylase (regulator of RNase III)
MTLWHIQHGEILDIPADGLLCSANVQLNLSGGVGGAILLRHGDEMQRWLHNCLRDNKLNYLPAGECILAPSCGLPYRAVAHAVAIDGFYDTNADLIERTYQVALTRLAEQSCRTVVAACLGCGFGRFPTTEFARVARRLAAKDFLGLDRVDFVTTNAELAEATRLALANGIR